MVVEWFAIWWFELCIKFVLHIIQPIRLSIICLSICPSISSFVCLWGHVAKTIVVKLSVFYIRDLDCWTPVVWCWSRCVIQWGPTWQPGRTRWGALWPASRTTAATNWLMYVGHLWVCYVSLSVLGWRLWHGCRHCPSSTTISSSTIHPFTQMHAHT